MADEDVVKAHELESHAAHTQLGALATINHHQVVSHVEHLARWLVARRHRRASASQYVQFKSCHTIVAANLIICFQFSFIKFNDSDMKKMYGCFPTTIHFKP
jgi:hypothetical protein